MAKLFPFPIKSIRFKVLSSVVIVLTIVMGIIFSIQYYQYRKELIERLGLSSTPLSDVIKGSLKHAMQTRNMEALEQIIKNVSMQKGVEKVFIFDKKGVIKVSPDEQDIGKRVEINDRTCQICHKYEPDNRNKTVIFTVSKNKRIFRNVNPILNEQECHRCHNPLDKINGVLISDFSMAEVDRELSSKMRQMIISLIITLTLTIITITFLMNRMVINRLEKVALATKLLSKGNLEFKVEMKSEDEIGELADSFNQMVENLKKMKELRERKELLENVLSNIKESIIIIDHEGRIISISKTAESMFGYRSENILGSHYTELGEERIKAWAKASKKITVCEEVQMKAGERFFPVSFTLTPLMDEQNEIVGFIEITRDLTEEKTKELLQKQLIHSERLAAMGRLAAGVAHELNNPLGNALLYARILLEEITPESPHYRNAQKIIDNIMRCKKIVSNLLDYTRQSEVHMELNDINGIIKKAVKMLSNELSINNIECELVLAEDLPPVLCDRNQIQQVFINLIQNAIEAVGNDGKIKIFSATSDNDSKTLLFGVWDNGPGIDPDIIIRIFEPFYTTKEKGTGLGLSICEGIIKRHGGKIRVESPPSKNPFKNGIIPSEGTLFVVELPYVKHNMIC